MRIRATILAVAACAAMGLSMAATAPAMAASHAGTTSVLSGRGWSPSMSSYVYRVTNETSRYVTTVAYGSNYKGELGVELGQVTFQPNQTVMIPGTVSEGCPVTDNWLWSVSKKICTKTGFLPYNFLTLKGQGQGANPATLFTLVIHVAAT